MSDKQRADHIQAKYWNGFLTRTEGQKVFDDFAKVIQAQGVAIQKLDAVISFMAEKFGITGPAVEAWVAEKIEQSKVDTHPDGPQVSELETEAPIEAENPGIKIGAAQFGGHKPTLVEV